MKSSKKKTKAAPSSDQRRSQNTVEIDLVAATPPERNKSRRSLYSVHNGQGQAYVPIMVVSFKEDTGLQDLAVGDAFRINGPLQCWHASNGRNFYSIHALTCKRLDAWPKGEAVNDMQIGLVALASPETEDSSGKPRFNVFAQYRPVRARPMELRAVGFDPALGLQDVAKGDAFWVRGQLNYFKTDAGREFFLVYTKEMEILT